MAFSAQFQNGNVIVVDSVKVEEAKTKKVIELIKNLKVEGKKAVFAINANSDFKLAARNIENVVVENIKNINAYQVLWADKIITTPEAIESIKERQSL